MTGREIARAVLEVILIVAMVMFAVTTVTVAVIARDIDGPSGRPRPATHEAPSTPTSRPPDRDALRDETRRFMICVEVSQDLDGVRECAHEWRMREKGAP